MCCLLALPFAARAQELALAQWGTPRAASYGFVSSEFTRPADIVPSLPLLASHQVGLVLDWPSSEVGSLERFAFVRTANAQGVEVHPWLLLPLELGYWPGSTNADAYAGLARALIDGWLAAGLAPSTLVVDMEMPIDRARAFAQVVQGGDATAAANYLRSITNRAQYAAATATYRALVDYAHGRGFKVEVSTWSQVLDDYADGDDGMRQGFNIPIDQIAWDTVSFQAYRTLNTLLNSTLPATTSYFVLDYALRARARFGTRAGVGVGMTDPGDLAPGAPKYTGGSQLREDVDAASWAGIARSKIGVYNLRGIVTRPPLEQWFPAPSLISLPPLPDISTLVTRLNLVQLDANL
jgi:hypothetical protein